MKWDGADLETGELIKQLGGLAEDAPKYMTNKYNYANRIGRKRKREREDTK